jgi:neutral ceramidase
MKPFALRSTSILLLVTLAFSIALHAAPKPFRAGAATSNITPNIGGDIVGGFNPFPSTHIHDELHARCLALDNGDTRLAFVVCDLLGADRAVFDEARRLVTQETGLPGANLIMSATHTHSAVSALGSKRFSLNQPLVDYQRFVARRIADGVRRAINNLAPAQIGWATASEPREVFNRRWFMKPGTVPVTPYGETNDLVKMNPPRASPNLDRPAGPTDPEICLIAVRSPQGKAIAVLANYSLHYVGGVGNGHISADYYGMFCDRMQTLIGANTQDPPFVAIMSNGTSGNINNIDFSKPTEKSAPYEKMRQVSDRIAEAVYKAYQFIEWHDSAQLGARLRELEVGARHPTPQQLERAKGILARPRDKSRATTLEEIYAERAVAMNEYPSTITIPIQLLRVGDVAVGGVPCEVFVEMGLEYKKKNPFTPSFIMEIANGYYGYLPTPEHHKLGGYETWLGTNRLEVEASNKILAALLEMAVSLKD